MTWYNPVVVLGSDSPTLPISYVEDLLDSLADVTLGPTDDGGYWGIACRRMHPHMFHSVQWSSGLERTQTADACRAAGLSVAFGRTWFDIDNAADLDRLLKQINLPKHTAYALQSIEIAIQQRRTGG